MTLRPTEALTAAFLDRSLPKAQWTHAAHLQVATWHLLRYPPAQALPRLRASIRRYNEATGVVNGPDSGYHETITRFYIREVARVLGQGDPALPLDALAARVVAELGARDLPLRYWSPGVLFSPAARGAWVEPDRAPLPDSPPAQ